MAKVDLDQLKQLGNLLDEGVIDQEEYDKKVQQMVAGQSANSKIESVYSKSNTKVEPNSKKMFPLIWLAIIGVLVIIGIIYISTQPPEVEKKNSQIIGTWDYDFSYDYVEENDGTTTYSDSYDAGWERFHITFDYDSCIISCEGQGYYCNWSSNSDGTIVLKDTDEFVQNYPELSSIIENLEYQEDKQTLYAFVPIEDDLKFNVTVFKKWN